MDLPDQRQPVAAAPAPPAPPAPPPVDPGVLAGGGAGRSLPGEVPVGDLVTGEAVVLQLRAASFASRLLASALDGFVVGVLLVVLLVVTAAGLAVDEAAESAVLLAEVVLCLVGVPVAVETLTRGRSLGKLVVGTRAVRDDGGPVRFRHAVVRGLLGFFELWALAGSPAIVAALATARGKRVGDLLAGTYVVRERTAARHVELPPMPHELAGWARTADVGRLPDTTALAARQFLGRRSSLHPDSRRALGVSLAAALARSVAPAPPAGTDPERFVTAVLVERRERELVALQRRRGRVRELERAVGRR